MQIWHRSEVVEQEITEAVCGHPPVQAEESSPLPPQM